jgi:hypothetical protein
MTRILAICTFLAFVAGALGAPILPTIAGHDFNFGAYNQDQTIEYHTNGVSPDTLTYTLSAADHEVTAYWPNWPNQPVYPVWDLTGIPNFGGDLLLGVQFTGQDAPIGSLDVSLIGTGLNTAPGAADLEIWGTIYLNPNITLTGKLWALDLEAVSLYGYSNRDTYALEGVGTIVDGLVAQRYELIGQAGAMRGHLDFTNRPPGWVPSLYHPDTNIDLNIRAGYSGETGWVPEPASFGLLLAGLALRRR